MLVDRATGKGHGLTLFATVNERRIGDEALNASPGGGGTGVSVEFFDVPVHSLGEQREAARAGPSARLAPLPDGLNPPGCAGCEQFVGVNFVGPADEVPLGLVVGRAPDGDATRLDRRVGSSPRSSAA